jgi:hypothetical protein
MGSNSVDEAAIKKAVKKRREYILANLEWVLCLRP